jgi:hypothetical protein
MLLLYGACHAATFSLSVFCAAETYFFPFFAAQNSQLEVTLWYFLLQKSASVPKQRKPDVRHTHIHPLHRTTQTHSTPKL